MYKILIMWEEQDLLQLHKLKLWLLSPNAKGLAAARAEVIRRTAGSGAVILMDDDAKAFALTTRESSGWLVGKKLSFNEVVKRLMIAHQEVPTAMLVGIQHWYRHTASPNDAGAVLTGLQPRSRSCLCYVILAVRILVLIAGVGAITPAVSQMIIDGMKLELGDAQCAFVRAVGDHGHEVHGHRVDDQRLRQEPVLRGE